ncbi:cdk10/11-like protein [Tribolium castaneum]|uniref:cyclin-dependent kinase n=1 Tax=Tribolium castaneum TaxID=7070 RepID=A0A139WBG9_TRICA|nr:cdk10/11-like protein [Tribolium castaneum]KYB25277.1 Serine/threonine-protein kinase PITSLRE-like Protein [Tribolium castaneum]|eukprot:NP_001164116.1 cdk10/11-like protein [Tribolium castaneum]
MSYNSADEQSEDGELRQSPETSRQKDDTMDFSLSEEDGENIDSLDIKPPQARVASQSSRNKRREGHESRSHHKRSERHREERHSHREKHHRDKQSRSNKEREHYQREKERYYREQITYSELQYYRERKEDPPRSRHSDARKYEEKKVKEGRGGEKHRRERLLSKRTTKGDELEKGERDKERKYREVETLDSALQGEAGMYVKEIINISTGEEHKRHKREEKELTEEERAQQELRKEKLLEAEREMARMKEQSRMERERRHAKRKQQDDDDFYNKRLRVEETNVVTVSDNSDEELEVQYEETDNKSDHSEESARSSTNSRHSRSDHSSDSRERSVSSERKSRSRSVSSERSASVSPKNGREASEEKEVVEEKEKKEESKPKIDEDLPPYYPAVQGCRSVEEFQCLNRIEEGTYGVVYRAKDKRTEDIVALKRLKMEKEKEGFPITSLREINTLLKGQHPNIVTVREIVVGSNMDKIFIVMDYVEHDLKSLMETMRHKKQNFMPGEVKCLLKQLLLAVAHLHDNWILHRDLKTSNLLLSHKGILKVGDFGLAREYGSPLKAYTPIVVTLWYRAPELLLCTKEYSTPIDMWSVGCIFAELLLMNALFPGKSEVDQLNRIFRDLGTPSEKIWPGFNKLPAVQKMKFSEYPVSNLRAKFNMLTDLGLNLLTKFLTFDPAQRVTAEEALQHTYFNEAPLPIDPAMFPTWPAKSELGQKRALAASPKPPSGGGEYKKLGGDGDDDGYGFRIGMGVENRRMGGGFSLKF